MKKPAIRVALIVDFFGGGGRTGEEEIEDHKADLIQMFGKRKLIFTTPYGVHDGIDVDLVVFDFGGVSIGNDLLGSNSRALIRWVQDHPSSLAVVLSGFSYNAGVKPELAELGLFIPKDPDDDSFSYRYLDAHGREPSTVVHNMIVAKYGSLEATRDKILGWFK